MKNLKWRLSKLPTVEELLQLVGDKVITQEEAKEILFSSETQEDRDKDSLRAEIKFLKELVENLSKNNTRIVEVIKEVERPWKQYPWYSPYQAWCSSGTMSSDTGGISFTTTDSGMSITTSNNAFSAIKSVN